MSEFCVQSICGFCVILGLKGKSYKLSLVLDLKDCPQVYIGHLKAVYRVWHEGLILKLFSLNTPGAITHLLD
jgi:hypothetical protein